MAILKTSIFARVIIVLKAMSVEPVAFLMLMCIMLSGTVSQTLALEKACRVNLQLPDNVCDALRSQDSDEHSDSERIVQEYVATLLSYKTIITSVLPCLLLIFAGGWMDLTGRRKVMMVLPILGQILQEISNIANVLLFYQLKVEVLMFSDAICSAMFGGYAILFLAVFSYITDITTEENRTYRLGLVSFSVSVGMPVGTALSGILLKRFGYLVVYIVILSLACINGCYLILNVKDPPRTREHKIHDNRGCVYFIKAFFSPTHFLNSLKVLSKKTQNTRAVVLCLLIAAACFTIGPIYGEGTVMYMSTRYRFQWDELQYSIFQSFNTILSFMASVFAMLVLSKKLAWPDSLLGILSTSCKIAAAFVYAFAKSGNVFFIGPIIDMLNGIGTIAIRSILSKSVEQKEIGKITSIISIAEVLVPLIYVPLYVSVYTSTMEALPGAVFLMGAGLTLPPLGVFVWLFYRRRRNINSSNSGHKSQTK